jgi:cbb3-type cytochrome oxidase subunit 3
MDIFFYFLIAVVAMALFSILVIAIYSTLEAKAREDEARRYARRILMQQLKQEEEAEARNKRLSL